MEIKECYYCGIGSDEAEGDIVCDGVFVCEKCIDKVGGNDSGYCSCDCLLSGYCDGSC